MWMTAGCLALVLSAGQAPADETKPQAPESQKAAGTSQPEVPALFIRAKRVYVRPGEVLSGAAVLVRGGKIAAVGSALEVPKDAQVLEAEVLCAGFIDPWSALCLDPGSRSDGVGTPATRSVDGFDPWSPEALRLETLRAGVTSVRIQVGATARIGGMGSVVRIAPHLSHEEAVLAAEACLSMNVGLTANAGGGGQSVEFIDGQPVVIDSRNKPMDVFDRLADLDRVTAALEGGRTYLFAKVEHKHELEEWKKKIGEKEAELEKDFKKAKKDREKEEKDAKEKGKTFEEKKYKEDKKPQPPRFDEDNEVMARVANGELSYFVQAHRFGEVRALLDGVSGFDRVRLVLVGGSASRSCAATLASRGVPVLVWPALRGKGAGEEYDGSDPSLAGDLAREGVSVLLGSGGVDPAATRDLPLLARLAVGHGLERDKAFEALTLGAARALDVAERVGSVERGKDADLLLLDGDPLDAATRVQRVISAGHIVLNPED